MNKNWVWAILVAGGGLVGCSNGPVGTVRPTTRLIQGIRAETAAERMVEARTSQLQAVSSTFAAFASAAIAFHADASVFGVPIDARLFYVAAKSSDGEVTGIFVISETVDGVTTHYSGRLSCMGIYDFDGGTANRAKIGGPIDVSDDPTEPAGTYIWWQSIDNARSPQHPPDKNTFAGFGDEAENIAFCQSPNPPRFGPFPADAGNIVVKVLGALGTLSGIPAPGVAR